MKIKITLSKNNECVGFRSFEKDSFGIIEECEKYKMRELN